MHVYSCYFFPNDLFMIFETQILLLEESLREASGQSLIVGDFNSKSHEELFILDELKRTGGRLKVNTALGIDRVPNEVLKEVIPVRFLERQVHS